MSHNYFDLHQLPVVNFNEFGTNRSEFPTENTMFFDVKDTNSKCYEHTDIKTKCSDSKNLINRRKLPSKNSTLLDMPGRKKKFSGKLKSRNLLTSSKQKRRQGCSNNIKQTFSLYGVFSQEIRYKFQNMLKSKPAKKKKKYTKRQKGRDNDIKVLFDSKARKHLKKLKKINVLGDCRKFNMLYDSKSSANVEDLKLNHRCKPSSLYHLFKFRSKSFLHRHKNNDNENCRSQTRLFGETLNVANKCTPVCECKQSVHYKLVDFPRSDDNSRNCSLNSKLRRHCTCKSISVRPSCFNLCNKGAGDSVQYIKERKNNLSSQKGDGDKIRCKRRRRPFKINHTLPSYKFDNSYFMASVKSALKISLLSIAIILWSPCILLLSFYWLLTYPLQPKHVLTQANIDNCNKCGSKYNCGHEFWHSIFHSIVRTSEKVVHAFNALCSSIRNHETIKIAPSHPSLAKRKSQNRYRRLKLHANPKNRYTLYYSRRRGWVIKTLNKYSKKARNKKRKRDEKQKRFFNTDAFRIENLGTCNNIKDVPYFKLNSRPVQRKRNRNLGKKNSKVISSENASILVKNSLGNENLTSNLSPVNNNLNTLSYFKRGRENQSHMNACQCSRGCLRNFYSTGTIRPPVCPFCPDPTHKYPYTIDHRRSTGQNWITCRCSHGIPPLIKPCPCFNRTFLSKLPNREACNARYQPVSLQQARKNKTDEISCKNECKKITTRKRINCWCQSVLKSFKGVVHEAETDVWDSNLCRDTYVSTLRRKPWFWIYRRCPSFYPTFLLMYKFYENVAFCFLLIISTCFWCPVICCCYLCYSLFCKCIS